MAVGEDALAYGLPTEQPGQRRGKMSLPGLVAIIFCSVCGGPFGSEEVVSAAGPLYAVLGFVFFPLVWSVPEALVTAELSTAFPENSGFVAWVTAAFGPKCGFLEGFLSWVCAVADGVLYPVLFCDYLKMIWPAVGAGVGRTACIFAFSILLTVVNFFGADITGWSAFALSLFMMLPFAYVALVGLPQVNPSNFAIRPALGNVDWLNYLNILFWNLNYWDTVSTVAGEVHRPERTLPLALGITVLMVYTAYLLPILVGTGISGPLGGENWADWDNGSLALVGKHVGGHVVEAWIVAASAVSNMGQFLSEQATSSYQLQGMAEMGFLPVWFARRSYRGTPTAGLLLSLGCVLLISNLEFASIVDFVSISYCMAQLLEFTAFVQLRRKHPELPRPFRVPLQWTASCVLLLLPAMVFAIVIMALPIFGRNWPLVAVLVAVPIAGLVVGGSLEALRHCGCVQFSCQPPADLVSMLRLGAAGGRAAALRWGPGSGLLPGEVSQRETSDQSSKHAYPW